jgi:hypothetical protein
VQSVAEVRPLNRLYLQPQPIYRTWSQHASILGAYQPGPETDDFVMLRKNRTRKSPTIGASVIIPRPSSAQQSSGCFTCKAERCGCEFIRQLQGGWEVALIEQLVHRAALTSLICLDTLSDIGTKVRTKPWIVLRNTLIDPHNSFFFFLIIAPGPDAEICVHRKRMLRHLLRVAKQTIVNNRSRPQCFWLQHLRYTHRKAFSE